MEFLNSMDLQGTGFGVSMKAHLLFQLLLPIVILTWYSSHLPRIWRSGHIGPPSNHSLNHPYLIKKKSRDSSSGLATDQIMFTAHALQLRISSESCSDSKGRSYSYISNKKHQLRQQAIPVYICIPHLLFGVWHQVPCETPFVCFMFAPNYCFWCFLHSLSAKPIKKTCFNTGWCWIYHLQTQYAFKYSRKKNCVQGTAYIWTGASPSHPYHVL